MCLTVVSFKIIIFTIIHIRCTQASVQLLEAVQQKVSLAEQLEQWESDIQIVIGDK